MSYAVCSSCQPDGSKPQSVCVSVCGMVYVGLCVVGLCVYVC